MGLDRHVIGFVVIRVDARSERGAGCAGPAQPLARAVALRTAFQWVAESVIGL